MIGNPQWSAQESGILARKNGEAAETDTFPHSLDKPES